MAVTLRCEFLPDARKVLDSLNAKTRSQVEAAIRRIQGCTPVSSKPRSVSRLKQTGEMRLRVRKLRVIYGIEDGAVIVRRIAHRREAYRVDRL